MPPTNNHSDFILDPALQSPPMDSTHRHHSPDRYDAPLDYRYSPRPRDHSDIGNLNGYRRSASPDYDHPSRKRPRIDTEYTMPEPPSYMHHSGPHIMDISSLTQPASAFKPRVLPRNADEVPTPTTGKRAAQACLRCRKQKLRCLGGEPCARCFKAKVACEYGKPGSSSVRREAKKGSPRARDRRRDADISYSSERRMSDSSLNQDENKIANLLVDLRGATKVNAPLHAEVPRQDVEAAPYGQPTKHSYHLEASYRRSRSPLQHSSHVRPFDLSRFGSYSASEASPRVPGSPPSSKRTLVATSAYSSASAAERTLDEAEHRAAQDVQYKSVPGDQPRPHSQSGVDLVRNSGSTLSYGRALWHPRDDPINIGIVDSIMGEILFQFYIDNCHPFLPLVNVTLNDVFSTVRQSASLFSATLAVAARFYTRYVERVPKGSKYPSMDPSVPGRLANLAEAHLTGTLLRDSHTLSDVQAVLILAAWGLRKGAHTCDAWIISGHASRIAKNRGFHKVFADAANRAKNSEPGSEEFENLEAFLPQWRTWLITTASDGLLSLSLGKPQSVQNELIDETSFLQLRLQKTIFRPGSPSAQSLYGDVYIACQVALARIGQDVLHWAEMLADPDEAVLSDPRRAQMFADHELTLRSMLKELNGKLDGWYKEYMWSGSQYTHCLGPSARSTRLQGEHMRLCVNSFAMRSVDEDEDEAVGPYLKKALNSATSTINTHFESSETDLALSFANDYLTIALAQAAVFIIRVTEVRPKMQTIIGLSNGMVTHYLRTATDLLESSDLSTTRLPSNLARKIRDIARGAGAVDALSEVKESDFAIATRTTGQSDEHSALTVKTVAPLVGVGEGDSQSADQTNGHRFADEIALDAEQDVGYLLRLPGDESAASGSAL